MNTYFVRHKRKKGTGGPGVLSQKGDVATKSPGIEKDVELEQLEV